MRLILGASMVARMLQVRCNVSSPMPPPLSVHGTGGVSVQGRHYLASPKRHAMDNLCEFPSFFHVLEINFTSSGVTTHASLRFLYIRIPCDHSRGHEDTQACFYWFLYMNRRSHLVCLLRFDDAASLVFSIITIHEDRSQEPKRIYCRLRSLTKG